jgi:PAS domain S-box-containing protein
VSHPPPSDVSPAREDPLRQAFEQTIALLEAALEAAHDAILVLDLNGRVVRHNHRFLHMFALSADELERRGSAAIAAALDEQLASPDRHASYAELFDNPAAEVRDTLHFKDGRVVERFAAPHRVGAAIVGRVTSYRDITDSVRTAEALEQYRASLEKAQEVAHVGSWVTELDGSGRLTWSNETCRIFGVERGAFAGTEDAFVQFVHPADREAVRRLTAAAAAGTAKFDIVHRIVGADGQTRWVHERADVVRAPDGTPVRLVGTVQDISERRLLEERLRQSEKLEAIGRLAGGVAHDLNNALTAIIGYTELALGGVTNNDQARADVLEIRHAAERAESVTRQLLAFSRKQVLEPKVFSLNDTIANLARLLGRTLGAGIKCESRSDATTPPIYGDPGQIEQAILNLAVNARDAMPQGGRLTLAVSTVDVDEAFAREHEPMPPGRYVQLAVADTGEGMPAATQAHIFEPFFTTKDVGKGTGLGLAMVYGTVKQTGGYIFVESAVGRGTTFRLYFPPARAEETAAAPPRAAALSPGAATILVAEDDPAVRNLVVAALGHEGYRVLHGASAEEALAIAAAETGAIDLLLTDANMPGMSGIELASAFHRQRRDVPVILMSGYTEEALAPSGLQPPMTLLLKPFTPRELRQKIADALARR